MVGNSAYITYTCTSIKLLSLNFKYISRQINYIIMMIIVMVSIFNFLLNYLYLIIEYKNTIIIVIWCRWLIARLGHRVGPPITWPSLS